MGTFSKPHDVTNWPRSLQHFNEWSLHEHVHFLVTFAEPLLQDLPPKSKVILSKLKKLFLLLDKRILEVPSQISLVKELCRDVRNCHCLIIASWCRTWRRKWEHIAVHTKCIFFIITQTALNNWDLCTLIHYGL